MEKPTETRRLRHLSLEINLREVGLQPYPVAFTREESPPVTSMLEEGVWYTHPERHEFVIVWAKDEAAIAEVLTYHYGQAGTAFNCLGPFLMRNLPVFRLTVLPSMTITSMVGLSVPHEPVFCGYVLLDCPLQSPGSVASARPGL